jgi:hypothetical protein
VSKLLSTPPPQGYGHGFAIIQVCAHPRSCKYVTTQGKIGDDCPNNRIQAVEANAIRTIEVRRYVPGLMTTRTTGSKNEEATIFSPFRMIDNFAVVLIV